jgi:hypothetical protein
MSAVMESLVRRYDAIKPHLTERQRRVWLGSEARELGSGGVGMVADAVQVSPDTVRVDAASSTIPNHYRWAARVVLAVGVNAPRNTIRPCPRRWTRWSTRSPVGIR